MSAGKLRAWFADAQFTRRDAVSYAAMAVALLLYFGGRLWHQPWMVFLAYAICTVQLLIGGYWAVRIVRLLWRRHREREAARARYARARAEGTLLLKRED